MEFILKPLCAGLLLSSLCSCAAMLPKASPADAQAVLRKSAEFRTATRNLGPSKETRVPLKRGQWVATLMRSKTDPNELVLQIIKIAEVVRDSVTIEMETYSSASHGRRSVMQQRLRNYPTAPKLFMSVQESAAALEGVEIVSLKMLGDDGSVQEIPTIAMGLGRAGADLLRSGVAVGQVGKAPCSSSTIQASSCYLVPFEAKVLWHVERGTSYAHSDIPIVGYVTQDGSSNDVEVIGYGNSGASLLIK